MQKLTRQQKILLAILLLGFAAAKVAALWWWQQQHPAPAAAVHTAACNVRQGCVLSQGSHVQFSPQSSAKSPFDIIISNAPADVAQVSVSFSMRGMDMGFNRYALQKQSDGSWVARQIRLPLCIDNRNDYLADITIGSEHHRLPFGIP